LQNEPLWPDATELVRLNQLIVSDTDEPHAVLNVGGLESACARPRNLWHYDDEWRIGHLASAMIIGIGRNHPFAQGNKRTALAGAIVFLENNGYILDHPDSDEFGHLIEAVILGDIHESALAFEIDEYLIETLW
jgi:death-on-curing protein